MVTSNHNGFQVLFDKIVFVCFIWKIIYTLALEMAIPWEPALCQLYRHTFVPYVLVLMKTVAM